MGWDDCFYGNLGLQAHCVKSVRIRSCSGSHFPEFGLNTERYSVSLRLQSECGKMRTRITPYTDTFLRSDRLVVTRKRTQEQTLWFSDVRIAKYLIRNFVDRPNHTSFRRYHISYDKRRTSKINATSQNVALIRNLTII